MAVPKELHIADPEVAETLSHLLGNKTESPRRRKFEELKAAMNATLEQSRWVLQQHPGMLVHDFLPTKP